MSIHDGHRERLKNRFRTEGLDAFDEHNVLELLLFYAVPRSDTNPAAHELLDTFGSLSAVFDAPIDALVKVKGVGENAATLIKLIPALARRYEVDKNNIACLASTQLVGEYLLSRYVGKTQEIVYLICLDGKYKPLCCVAISEGIVNTVSISARRIIELALKYNAVGVVLAHNHPGGIALPSNDDISTTFMIRDALRTINVKLLDHIVVADGDYVSMADSGMLYLPE